MHTWSARVHLAERKYALALAALDTAERLEPEDADVHAARAEVYLAQTKWMAAEESARHALGLDPDDVNAQNILSHALLMQGRVEETEAHIAARMERDPEDPATHTAAGYAALRRGDHRAAERHFAEALRLESDSEAARDGLITSFRARSAVYRNFLAYSFRVSKIQAKYRAWIFLGLYVVYRLVYKSLEKVSPVLAGLLAGTYILFAVWTFVARGVATLFILRDPMARLALRTREKAEAWLSGATILTGLALLLLSLIPGLQALFGPGFGLAAMSIPWALCLNNDDSAGRRLYGVLAGLCSLGTLLLILEAATGWSLPAAFLLAVFPAVLSTWLGLFGVKHRQD